MRVNHRAIVLLTVLSILVNATVVKAQAINGRTASDRASGNPSHQAPVLSYRAEEPLFRKITDPSGRYVRMALPGHHYTSETGMPELPVYSRLVEVPAGMDVIVSCSSVKSQRVRFADHGAGDAELFPVQPAKTKNEPQDDRVTFKDKKAYSTKGIISHDTVVVRYEGIYRGHRLANIAVYPAFYDPKGAYVDLITSMEMKISYEPSSVKGDEEGSVDGEKGGYVSDAYVPGYTDKPIQMIIVTDSAFIRYLAPLVRWKMLKGIRTTVICRKAGPPDTVYNDLKKRISEAYFKSVAAGSPVQYLLIAGSPSIIPTSRVTANVSDLYYGEFDGEGDYIPELFIGRIPAADTTQLKGMVKKIIDYETWNYSPSNDFWSGAVATAGNAPGFEIYMNGQVRYIYDNYLGKDTSLKAVRWLYPDAQLKDDSLKILFNKGLGILNYTGHGEAAGFSDPQFRASMVNDLTNVNEYPLIIANACRTAQINVTPCFGTSMVTTSGKGAIGYIGCTNDSYWVDDFFWAVGPSAPGLNITYETSARGAFDRLFHTHGEPPGEWYHTMGQINFSGNLSVSASTSPRKRYYWETYILLGDPSLSPVIGRPGKFEVVIPPTLPQELTSLTFFADPFSYAALSDFDTLWDARFVSPSGNVSLAIPPGVKDSCLLIITGQNKLPYMKTIRFGTVPGPFLTVDKTVLNDFGGNNNGIPEYGEHIRLIVTVKNLGQGTSNQLQASIESRSAMITVDAGSATIGTLLPGASYTISGNFIFSVSDQVEDGEMASLLLTLKDQTGESKSGIDMTLHAPQLKIVSSVHDDQETGNSNFLPDPGETINLVVKVKNVGSSAASGTVTVTPLKPGLAFSTSGLPSGIVEPGQEKAITFETTVSDLALPGTVIPYSVRFVCGNYEAEGTWSISTGKTRETWEFNRFDVFPWIQRAENPWTITSSSSFENVLSARSGAITDKQETVLAIYVNNPVADTISFYSRVSSEPTYDELTFRIDSTVDMSISGDTPWALRKKLLKPGVHLLEWIYKKDVSLSGGLDAAWIDMITFPDISFLEADLQIDTVFPPPASAVLTDVAISGRVINFGRNALTSFPLAYRINNDELVNETFFRKIDPGDTALVVFSQKCNLLPDVGYRISIINRLPEDGYAGNDTASVSFIKSWTGPVIAEKSVKILPNPFRDSFVLEFDFEGEENTLIELTDSGGRMVMRMMPGLVHGSNRIPFDCRQLAPGVYTLHINQGGKSITMKVVKS